MDVRGVIAIGKSCPRQVESQPIFPLFCDAFPTITPYENHRFAEAFWPSLERASLTVLYQFCFFEENMRLWISPCYINSIFRSRKQPLWISPCYIHLHFLRVCLKHAKSIIPYNSSHSPVLFFESPEANTQWKPLICWRPRHRVAAWREFPAATGEHSREGSCGVSNASTLKS